MADGDRVQPPDQEQRRAILTDLDSTILVEAAAGTGKTTSMVGRMVNLLAAGKCSVETMAAVTFTRKAAAELRSRFQIELEKAQRDPDPSRRLRLGDALSRLESCFIGTIHSLCARMLRERPVEAGVSMDFQEIDQVEDLALRSQAWHEYVSGLYAAGDPILTELDDLGVEIGRLGTAFLDIADFPDVQDWPAVNVPLPDLGPARAALEALAEHVEQILPTLPEDPGNDGLMPRYRRIPLLVRQVKRGSRISDFMEVLAEFKAVKVVKKNWPGRGAQAEQEMKRWDSFRATYAEPLLKAWREHRYEPLLRAIRLALPFYERLRMREGKLSYQDLLVKSADMLRAQSNKNVREHFRGRFTHLLVDEFQDTDPVQAEVVMLLASQDLSETDWRRCTPVPGSLFVVGDPKQSIYRFRRADIVTYNQVKDIIRNSGGKVIHLTGNFRTTPGLASWINHTFQEEFDQLPVECSPRYVGLVAVRSHDGGSELSGLSSIAVPKDCSNKAAIGEYDADFIARYIRDALDRGKKVARSDFESSPEAKPEDFLIVTRNKENLGLYSRKLQELRIPHQVTGGKALNQVRELGLLHTCLTAVTRPDDALALVAVLRGELFGISDAALFAFKQSGGSFTFHAPIPDDLPSSAAEAFKDAFDRLRRYSHWMRSLPAISAVERIVGDLGLQARAAAGQGGDILSGSLAKAIELLRVTASQAWSASQIVDYLGRLVQEDEAHDSISARAYSESAVRLMNLHKVKGLEAPVVFLADPTGNRLHTPELYVDRSGDRVLGYLAVHGTDKGSNRRVLLAQPLGWEHFADAEARFQKAEELRLLYVAATRAGCGLTVSLRGSYPGRSPWTFFQSRLTKAPQLEDPGSRIPRQTDSVPIARDAALQAASEIGKRWSHCVEKTYEVVSVKGLTVKKGRAIVSHGEHGTEWGSILHTLLQAAMLDGNADLSALAQAALTEQGLSTDLVHDAIEEVQAVMQSETWLRAKGAQKRLVEAPYQLLVPAAKDRTTGPTILRGVIDLAFKEPAGWVVVDYKSDRISPDHTEALVESYAPQVASYARAWTEITGEIVHEAGLYFTHLRKYVPVMQR